MNAGAALNAIVADSCLHLPSTGSFARSAAPFSASLMTGRILSTPAPCDTPASSSSMMMPPLRYPSRPPWSSILNRKRAFWMLSVNCTSKSLSGSATSNGPAVITPFSILPCVVTLRGLASLSANVWKGSSTPSVPRNGLPSASWKARPVHGSDFMSSTPVISSMMRS